MSLMLALLPAVMAQAAEGGTAVFVDTAVDPTVLPRLRHLSADEVRSDSSWSSRDEAALDALDQELEAVAPLVDEFDGELAIMARLGDALAPVEVLQTEQDRALVHDALLLRGFAAWRYFQDQLATDPAAEAHRVEIQGQWMPRAWVDAVALDPERAPSEQYLADPDARRAFDELQAALRLAPRASILVPDLPEGAGVSVDGREPSALERVRVPPGQHRVAVVLDGEILVRGQAELAPEGELELRVGATASDLRALVDPLRSGPPAYSLTPEIELLLGALDVPVHLVVPGPREPWVYRLEGPSLVLVGEQASAATSTGTTDTSRVVLRAEAGVGWMYDGDWLLQNLSDGAPQERSTVNAATPLLGLAGELRPGPLAVGAGVDLAIPTGAWSTLPVGDSGLRLRVHPHLYLGHPVAHATVGWLFPWQLGLGARLRIPVGERLSVGGGALYGLGVARSRDDGSSFEPSDSLAAWATVGARFGL